MERNVQGWILFQPTVVLMDPGLGLPLSAEPLNPTYFHPIWCGTLYLLCSAGMHLKKIFSCFNVRTSFHISAGYFCFSEL